MHFSEYQYKSTEFLDNAYDENIKLLYLKRNPNNDLLWDWKEEYAYQLLASIEYADRLLISGDEESISRAEDIIFTCIKLQNKDRNSTDFSFFPYHKNIPEKYISIDTDNNTVSFKIGVQLLLILKKHKNIIGINLKKEIEASVYNVLFKLSTFYKIHYFGTFVHFIQTYLLFLGGEYFDNADFFHCASTNLSNTHSALTYHRSLHEYNSFYEMSLISEILTDIKNILIDKTLLRYTDEIYTMLWKTMSQNFHPGFSVFAGPSSNVSRNTPRPYILHFISVATGIKFDYEALPYVPEINSRCPEKYIHSFSGNTRKKFILNPISYGQSTFSFFTSRIVSCFIHPDYTIGSFNHQSLFFENTSIYGCMKSDIQKEPYRFTVEVVNNDTPVALAVLHSVQYNDTILGAFSFCRNFGHMHTNISQHGFGVVPVSDFNIRFKITGNIPALNVTENRDGITVNYSDIYINYKIPYIHIDSADITFELTRTENTLCYNANINKGKNGEIDFSKLSEAICQFILTINKKPHSYYKFKHGKLNNFLEAELETDEYSLKTITPYIPDTFQYATTVDRQLINNQLIDQFTESAISKARQYKFIAESVSKTILPDIEPDNTFTHDLAEIEYSSMNQISIKTQHLLRNLARKNISIEVFNRYAVQIITAVFERIKRENIQFERMINNNYSDIYHQISFISDKKKVIELVQSISDDIQKKYTETEQSKNNITLVKNIVNILENNYSNPDISLTLLSSMTGFSEPYISKQFKKITGTNYIKYLSKIRIEKAKEFLNSGMSPQETAEKCGFSNLHTFRRVFREQTGHTTKTISNL